jgi:hypothetical protein
MRWKGQCHVTLTDPCSVPEESCVLQGGMSFHALQGGVSFLEGGVTCHGLSRVSCHVHQGGVSCHVLQGGVSCHVLQGGVSCHVLQGGVSCHVLQGGVSFHVLQRWVSASLCSLAEQLVKQGCRIGTPGWESIPGLY